MHNHIKQIAVYLIKLVFKLAHALTHTHACIWCNL